MAKLVIVESPAKAKTIGKYLGKDYKVTASMGHIRDLPASQLGIDVENGYTPRYITIKGKEKLVRELKDEAKHSDGVLLATDPDREGEAISWHLANVLGLDPSQPNRITFDEITKKGVQEGMAHPRAIDMDLFNAQQARRELDRLVGYKLSPFLWRKVRRGLSAGRVQSVAVRLIRDREIEIEKFIPDEYWNIDAEFGKGRTAFTARLAADAEGKKLSVTNKDQADGILAALEGKTYTVTQVDKGRRRRVPPPPFITSTLQQEASRRYGFSATRTMRAAQTLYEGVEIAGHRSDHLYAYRLAARLGRGGGRGQGVYRRPLGRALYLQDQAQIQVPFRHCRPGRPRSHPSLGTGPDPRRGGRQPDRRYRQALPPDLEPLYGQPDGGL